MGSYDDKISLYRRFVRTSPLMSGSSVACSTRMSSAVIRLLIVADFPVVRHGLRQIFGGAPDIRIVAESREAADLTKQISACDPDVVLLDFAGKASYELFCQLQMQHRHLPILIFSTAQDRYAKKAFQRGAMGYVTKDHAPDHLVLAIRAVVAGEPYVWPSIAPGWGEQFTAVITAWLDSIAKVCNPRVWSTAPRSSSHR